LFYEWDHARIGGAFFLGSGGSWSNSMLGVSADWLPLSGSWTPYVGAGGGLALIGKKRPWEYTGEQLVPPYLNLLPMLSMEGGVELFRNRPTRLLIGAEVELPWSRPYECNADFTSCGVVWRLRYPVVALKTRLIF
jgi:hypothetical protein